MHPAALRWTMIGAVVLSSCTGGEEGPAEGRAFFVDVAAESGIEFVHTAGGQGDYYLIETMGAGGAFFDYDSDGLLDIYLVEGFSIGIGTDFSPLNLLSETSTRYLIRHPMEYRRPPRLDGEVDSLAYRVRQSAEPFVRNRLYRNNGERAEGTFSDRTSEARVGDTGYGMGCAVGDYDNDGDADLYVVNYGPNTLYRNEADGSFVDVTEHMGVGDPSWSAGAAFFDYDSDGRLDLYVVNYLDFHVGNNLICGGNEEAQESPAGTLLRMRKDRRSYCSPKGYNGAADVLYHNTGSRFESTFENVTREMGIFSPYGKGLGVVTSDFDGDGDTDVYVANDGVRNFLYRNEGGEQFADIAVAAGAAYNRDGRAEAGMGVDWGDFDGDADFDLFVTNYSRQTNTLYRNDGAAVFNDVTDVVQLSESSHNPLGFGTFFFEADNDGDVDLFVANGHVQDKVHFFAGNEGITYPQPNQLFANSDGREYVEVSSQSGPGLEPVLVSRGSAFGDYDNDGDLDILVTNCDGPAQLLRNDLSAKRNWLSVRLIGRDVNRDAVGSRIAVTCDGATQVREVKTSGSYASASDIRQHFGLGDCGAVQSLEIIWHDGSLQLVDGKEVLVNQFLTIEQEDSRGASRQ